MCQFCARPFADKLALGAAWFTTIHLSSSTLQVLYNIPKLQAANAASVILLASTPLYPILGWLFDKRPQVMRGLYLAVPSAIATSYAILLLVSDPRLGKMSQCDAAS